MNGEQFEREVWTPNRLAVRHFVIKRSLCDDDEAEDIMALTMEAAYNSIDTYAGDGTLLAWLCGIAKHKALDYQRRRDVLRGHGREVPWPLHVPGEKDAFQVALPDPRPTPEELAIQEDTRQDVARVLAAMRPRYRELLQLKYLCELEMTEMAYILDRSFKSVESGLTAARQQFRSEYRQQMGLPEGV